MYPKLKIKIQIIVTNLDLIANVEVLLNYPLNGTIFRKISFEIILYGYTNKQLLEYLGTH